jgi:chromosome segregation ATPase
MTVLTMRARKQVLLFTLLMLAMAGIAHAASSTTSKTKLYKWVDKDGVTQYGSSVPPEYASQQSEQLDAQGQVVKVQQAQKTPEQVAEESAAQKQAEQKAIADAQIHAHDKVLLDTYTSVPDIERDRDSKLSAIDAQITVLNGSITAAQNTLADFQDRASELTQKNKPVPPDLQKHIDSAKQQLILNQQQLLAQQQHKQQMTAQFVSDIARFKELMGGPAPAPAATTH